MTAVVIRGFGGMRPAMQPRFLNDNEAQLAKNTKLNNGALRAMKNVTTVNALALAVQTIYRYGQTASNTASWFQFADDADVILSPVVQDSFKRIYWSTSSSTTVRYAPESVAVGAGTYPSSSYILGVPKPTGVPSASGTAAAVYTQEARDYIVVYTGASNSPPSDPITVNAVNTYQVIITGIPVPDASLGYTGKNLYRRSSGTSNVYKLVASLATSATEYTDTIANASLGATYTPPTASTVSAPENLIVSAPTVATPPAAATRYYAYTTGGYNYTDGIFEAATYRYVDQDYLSPFVSISADQTQSITISGMTVGTATDATYFRIFRKDSLNGQLYMIAQIPVSQTTFVDSLATASSAGTMYQGANVNDSTLATVTLAASASTLVSVVSNYVYCATYVNSTPTEGYRSAESAVVRALNGQTKVTINLPSGAPEGAVKTRIYRRTATVSSGTISGSDADYKLLAEIPVSQVVYEDTATQASISANAALPVGSRGGVSAMPSMTESAAAATIPSDIVPETRVYVYTYVSAYGEEGPPSDPSTSIDIDPDQAVTVSAMSTAPAGAYNITKKRIYRSSTGSTSAAFQFVAEIAVATTSYSDTIKQTALGEVLLTEGWIAAGTGNGVIAATSCNPNMKGLTLSANGIAAGFVEKTLHFSEPFLPHTFPAEYTQTTEFNIVGLASFGQSFAVLTTANPYIASGVDGASMSMTKIPLPQGCVSKRSICPMADGVVYASPDGLVSLTLSSAQILTKGLLSRDQWQAYSPSSMLVRQYNDKIFVFHSTGLIVFDFSGESASMQTFDQTANAAYFDPIQDALYIAVNGTGIQRWDTGSDMTYTWKSKLFSMPMPVNFTFGQVEASAYPITFKIYCDGVLKHTKSVTTRDPFRLPAGFKAKDLEVELSGTGEVFQCVVAQSAIEVEKT